MLTCILHMHALNRTRGPAPLHPYCATYDLPTQRCSMGSMFSLRASPYMHVPQRDAFMISICLSVTYAYWHWWVLLVFHVSATHHFQTCSFTCCQYWLPGVVPWHCCRMSNSTLANGRSRGSPNPGQQRQAVHRCSLQACTPARTSHRHISQVGLLTNTPYNIASFYVIQKGILG